MIHHLREMLSGTSRGQGFLWRLDVRVKWVVAVAAILAVVLSRQLVLPLTVFAGCVGAALAVGARPGLIARRLTGPLALAAVVALLRAFMTGLTPTWSVGVGPFHLVATREGIWEGMLIGGRVLGAVSVVMLLYLSSPAYAVLSALRWAKVPRGWVEIMMLMYRYIFILLEQAVSVVSAQKARLGYGKLGRGLSSAGNLAGIVMLRSIDQAEKTHEAMVSRGYRGLSPLPPLPPLPARAWAAMSGCVALIAAAWLAAQRWLA